VAVSPGVGFGDRGDRYVRFALVKTNRESRSRSWDQSFLHDEPDWPDLPDSMEAAERKA